ncbi:MAG TPA: sulfite exporter TauE/SafE family protein [Sporolactobacillaceae bacterium]|nr:sulfite exporter TauE/SafE family protein [Sporolactobacillaceae bacterium]
MYSSLSLAAALGLGVLHSLEPGHGKGVMSAYILSTRANAFQSTLLGLIAALSHAFSIFLLAWLASLSVQYLTPDQFIHWLEFFSGIFILLIGVARLKSGLKHEIITVKKLTVEKPPHTLNLQHHHHHHHEESHHHSHTHAHHFHYHPKKPPANLRQFVTVGFLTGIIPCPSALALILAAISTHHLFTGIKLVFAFSIGGALTMATLGLAISHASQKVKKVENVSFVKMMTVASGALIVILGFVVVTTAFFHVFD